MFVRIFKPTFTIRRSLLVLGTVIAGLAFPAASMAATDVITTSPIHKGSKGFMLSLNFEQGMPTGYGGRLANSIAGILVKKSDGGHATETDTYAFSATRKNPLKYKTGKKALQFGQVTGTFANGGGSVHLTFHATGKATHVTVPKGCTSYTGARSGTKRTGTLSGSYTLHAGDLGTITQKEFKKATISTVAWTCNQRSQGYEVQTTGYKPAWVDVFLGPKGKVEEQVEVAPAGDGWEFTHSFMVRDLPSSDYTLNKSKLNAATVKGAGGITGTATYSSKKSSPHRTTGKMSGSLAVTMAAIGKVTAFPSPRYARQNHT